MIQEKVDKLKKQKKKGVADLTLLIGLGIIWVGTTCAVNKIIPQRIKDIFKNKRYF